MGICEKEITLYLADNTSNLPIENAKIVASIEGDIQKEVEALSSNKAGIYKIPSSFKEGRKIHLMLTISSSDLTEKLSIDIPVWPKPSAICEG